MPAWLGRPGGADGLALSSIAASVTLSEGKRPRRAIVDFHIEDVVEASNAIRTLIHAYSESWR